MITAAPTTPVTWDRDPACSATAVRDPLVLTGKPWKKPAAMFAAPMPTISWLPRTCSPRRAAKRGRRGHGVRQGDDGDGERADERAAGRRPTDTWAS